MANKDIRYVNKDFYSLREALINFTKSYYPTTYKDFNETSPGMMFMEHASYIGDVLSYYTDNQFKESLFLYADERENVLNFSYLLGYKPKVIVPSTTQVDVYQIVPSNGLTGTNNAPDMRYAVKVRGGMVVGSSTNTNVLFRTMDDVDFSQTASAFISVFSINNGTPDYYLIKKSVDAVAGNLKTETFSFGAPERFQKILLSDNAISDIVSVVDGEGKTWYEVPFLAQDTIALAVPNTSQYDASLSAYKQDTPYLLKLKQVPNRFEVRIRADNKTELRFGSGISDSQDEEIVPNTSMLGSSLPDGNLNFSQNIDPTNFLFTRTYGQIPHNTTMTVSYYSGGGPESNVSKDDISTISSMILDINETGLNPTLVAQVKNSIAVINPIPATGGRNEESLEEIKMNAMAQYASQNRAVTREDYIIRTLAMPSKFGSVAKAYVHPDNKLDANPSNDNQFGINLYVLSYDSNKKLVTPNMATLTNLKTYIDQYRILTDAIRIVPAFVINIAIRYSIVVLPKYNKNEVKLRTIDAVKRMFNIDKWQINQPIIINDIITAVSTTEGVQSVVGKPDVYCLYSSAQGYSGNFYDTKAATINDVVYPSLDPAIFEVKFLDNDIQAQVVTY